MHVTDVTATLADDDPASQGESIYYRDLPDDPEDRTIGESRSLVREPKELAVA